MRDPDRIAKMMTILGDLWEDNPDWRLGQLIENVMFATSGDRVNGHHRCMFHIEDDVAEQALVEAAKRWSKD